MKSIIFTFIVLFVATIAAKAFDYETSQEKVYKLQEDKEQAENNFNLMDLLQVILKDPEFLQLDSRQQLSVLFAIYNILENRFNKKI
jgi:hypothetical protein